MRVEPYMNEIAEMFFSTHASPRDLDGKPLDARCISFEAVRRKLEEKYSVNLTRTEIESVIRCWRESNRIQVTILPEAAMEKKASDERQIRDLAHQLKLKFKLLDCHLVCGPLDNALPDASMRRAALSRVIRDLGQVGGRYLSDAITEVVLGVKRRRTSEKRIGVCVGAGGAVQAAIEQISFDSSFGDVGVDLIPMTGLLGWRRVGPSPLANARRLEYIISGNASLHWYSTPAIIPTELENGASSYDATVIKESLESLPMVREVDQLRKKSIVYIFSVSEAPKVEKWASPHWRLINKQSAEKWRTQWEGLPLVERPVGAISGLVFNEAGKEVKNLPWLPMGVTLDELRVAAARKKHPDSLSILIVGGHRERVPALRALLKSGCVNVLITDVYSAREVLKTSVS